MTGQNFDDHSGWKKSETHESATCRISSKNMRPTLLVLVAMSEVGKNALVRGAVARYLVAASCTLLVQPMSAVAATEFTIKQKAPKPIKVTKYCYRVLFTTRL